MGVNVAAHTRHIFLGSAPPGAEEGCQTLKITLHESIKTRILILPSLWYDCNIPDLQEFLYCKKKTWCYCDLNSQPRGPLANALTSGPPLPLQHVFQRTLQTNWLRSYKDVSSFQ